MTQVQTKDFCIILKRTVQLYGAPNVFLLFRVVICIKPKQVWLYVNNHIAAWLFINNQNETLVI